MRRILPIKLYKYTIQVDLIINHKICGFEEPFIESRFPLFNRKIIKYAEVELIEKLE
jgi:hypothetical protein